MKTNKAKIFRNGEAKAIELVAKILRTRKIVRNKGVFEWLRGDKRKNGRKGLKLRVDAWFPEENLVLEYHGIQHFKPSKLMDRRKGRAAQRRKYTWRRQILIPKHGINLMEIRYDEPLTEEYIRPWLCEMGYKVKKYKI